VGTSCARTLCLCQQLCCVPSVYHSLMLCGLVWLLAVGWLLGLFEVGSGQWQVHRQSRQVVCAVVCCCICAVVVVCFGVCNCGGIALLQARVRETQWGCRLC
jgi:hypothetical protein